MNQLRDDIAFQLGIPSLTVAIDTGKIAFQTPRPTVESEFAQDAFDLFGNLNFLKSILNLHQQQSHTVFVE